MIWIILLKMATRLTGWLQMKVTKAQWRAANLPARVTIAHFPLVPQSLPPSINTSKQLGGQVGYPAHQQKGRPLDEISQKLDCQGGQGESKQQEPLIMMESTPQGRSSYLNWFREQYLGEKEK